jgi:uncharacterized protein YndB with AHSA1/START domain
MEFGKIERRLEINASPATVFEVITSPGHLKEWWPDDAVVPLTPGAEGELVFGNRAAGTAQIPKITVVEAEAPRIFSFRWVYPEGETPADGNSLLVTFELEADGAGTVVHMTETGFREKGWEVAVLEEQYLDHSKGWDTCLAKLVTYAASVGARS